MGLVPWRVGCNFLNAEIAELTEHFKWNIIADYGRHLEVSRMSCSRSPSIQSSPARVTPVGLAPRFPRIKAIRRDKDVGSVDTFQYARDLAEQPANLPVNFGRRA